MLLLFRGENAVRHLKEDVIGRFTDEPVGDTVRGTYGDFLRGKDGMVDYFEPAVITCPDPKLNDQHLRLLAEYADNDGGVLTGQIKYDSEPEVSLVMLRSVILNYCLLRKTIKRLNPDRLPSLMVRKLPNLKNG